jgi:hypothetical protein
MSKKERERERERDVFFGSFDLLILYKKEREASKA